MNRPGNPNSSSKSRKSTHADVPQEPHNTKGQEEPPRCSFLSSPSLAAAFVCRSLSVLKLFNTINDSLAKSVPVCVIRNYSELK
eukprot:c34647_g1_i1 orf=92-343(+)